MYAYIPTALIIKAFENGWRSIFLPILQTQNIDCYTIMNKGKVGGWDAVRRTAQETSAGQARACSVLLAPLAPLLQLLPGTLRGSPNTTTSSQRELNLPLRQTKQASKGNVQNRNQKMSTSSRQTSKQRKNQLSVPEPSRGWGVSGFLRPFSVSPTLCLPQ